MPSERQMELLRLLLDHKQGLTIDELSEAQGITRPAVRQHLSGLERDGYVAPGELRKTSGRPVRAYALTERGQELFPKQYSWFSGLMLDALRQERGSEGLADWLRDIARTVAASLQAGQPPRTSEERLAETVRVMNGLAYQAVAIPSPGLGESAAIEATHCVYHDLAQRFPEVCEFDLQVIGDLTGATVEHQECIVRGGQRCRFRLQPRD